MPSYGKREIISATGKQRIVVILNFSGVDLDEIQIAIVVGEDMANSVIDLQFREHMSSCLRRNPKIRNFY